MLDSGTIKGILENEIDNSLGYIDSETVEDRKRALEYYLRQPYGNEVEGRSQIVTGEVAEAIDGALPQLIRVFTTTEDIVYFEPKSPGDEESAKQATDYCNWVFYRENDGLLILHNWFKDALLQKVGVVKSYWDEALSQLELDEGYKPDSAPAEVIDKVKAYWLDIAQNIAEGDF